MIEGHEAAGHTGMSSGESIGPVIRRLSPAAKLALVAAGLYMAAGRRGSRE